MNKLKVFIGSGEASLVERKTLVYSILKHSNQDRVEVFAFNGTHDTLENTADGSYERVGLPLDIKYMNTTEFTHYRWYVAKLSGYKGRAVFMDSDMICTDDIAQLLDVDMQGASIMMAPATNGKGYKTSFMLIDCEKFKYDPEDFFQAIRDEKIEFKDLLAFTDKFLALFPLEIKPLDGAWNSYDRYKKGVTKITHFTNLETQPWKYDGHPFAKFWKSYMLEALKAGILTKQDIKKSVMRRYVKPDILVGKLRYRLQRLKMIWRKQILGKYDY